MKKTLQYISVLCLLSAAAFGQSRSRVFDNFDTSQGVKVATPTIAPITESKDKKLVKKTAQVSTGAGEGIASKSKVRLTSYSRVTMARERSLGNFTTGDSRIDSYIVDSSKRYNIDPLLIYAQMHQESSFKLKALSYKGASGLMQLMPATARRLGVTDIYNPKQNIEGGIKYMRILLDMFGGDVVLALAGYNAGEGAVLKYGRRIPPYRETQEYVRRITTRYNSIVNPNLPNVAVKVTKKQAKELEEKISAPLTAYEPNPVAIRLTDGRIRLVNQ
ncbi:MAG TPA: lytic transglycosylase domain-containing protein [Pyrinomonadaceae bacterium]|nr:lytic transglycosylase domain-containing protein [Pyrinomonadaceae bacterium]